MMHFCQPLLSQYAVGVQNRFVRFMSWLSVESAGGRIKEFRALKVVVAFNSFVNKRQQRESSLCRCHHRLLLIIKLLHIGHRPISREEEKGAGETNPVRC